MVTSLGKVVSISSLDLGVFGTDDYSTRKHGTATDVLLNVIY